MSTDKLNEKIQELINEAYDAFELSADESIDDSIEILNKAWELLPADKYSVSMSYDLIKEFVETYYYVGELEKAEDWIDKFLECDKLRADYGEAPYVSGKIKYDLGKFDEAKELFALADKKSGGRMFKRKDDPKYFLFYKKK